MTVPTHGLVAGRKPGRLWTGHDGIVKLTAVGENRLMESLYRRHRFPPEIISHAVWLYHWFTLSSRDVEMWLVGLIIAVPAGVILALREGLSWGDL